jgi:hypothetical protein
MVSTLKSDLSLKRQLAAAPPQNPVQGLYDLEAEDKALLKITEEFIRHEREGIKQYQDLLKVSKGYHHGLFGLLCSFMIRDTRKHVDILRFLRARLKRG